MVLSLACRRQCRRLALPAVAAAQVAAADNGNGRKQARAVRVADGCDPCRRPARRRGVARRRAGHRLRPEGAERRRAADRAMEVRFAYDDDALYVGARMHSSDADPGAAGTARRRRAGRAPSRLARHLSRSPHGVHVRRHRHRRPPRPLLRERRRVRRRRHVRPGVAGAHRRSTARAGPRSCGFRSRSCASTIAIRRSGD